MEKVVGGGREKWERGRERGSDGEREGGGGKEAEAGCVQWELVG